MLTAYFPPELSVALMLLLLCGTFVGRRSVPGAGPTILLGAGDKLLCLSPAGEGSADLAADKGRCL